ncbi:MAG: amylo-alpha-1,6-glucosidase [Myxococcota bacterium]
MRHPSGETREWLEADGLGGFAMGTASGLRTRRYHALLVAAAAPPGERSVLLEDLEVVAETAAGRFPLTARRYPSPEGDLLHPDVTPAVFHDAPWPRWEWTLPDGTRLTGELIVPRGAAQVALRWRRRVGAGSLAFVVRPFLSGRSFHALERHTEPPRFPLTFTRDELRWALPGPLDLRARPAADRWRWKEEALLHRQALFAAEANRGLDALADLASPGAFVLEGEDVQLTFGSPGPDPLPAFLRVADDERQRRARLAPPQAPARLAQLHRAADAYIVRRGTGRTVIAGYPWFGDWGRDTFIALRGLCLATGRLDVAADVVRTWAAHVDAGMLPNRFPDGEAPEYHSVDAALWYAFVAGETLDALDAAGVRDPDLEIAVRDAVIAILTGHRDGTRHGIAVEADGLLRAGVPGLQLTWMDAKVGDHVVTPRIGKPVEIQALWVHALRVGERFDASWALYRERAEAAFAARFPLARGGLADVVDAEGVEGRVDGRLRPNQLLALGGLRDLLVPREVAARALERVLAELWTPLGPRSLARAEDGYRPRYGGGVAERDGAYHQGTVWPWLLGPLVDAWLAVHGDTPASRSEARARFLPALHAHLDEAGLGHVSEIADAEAPHGARGAPFQAWSVSELLRVTARLAG